MKDINFVIVNSNLNHALMLRSELETRVSFEVFQDTDEEDVWNKMEGGKDDIYVYDRCGRLVYYIPYPLSVMNSADNLVPRAIVSAYFEHPCGESCESNVTFTTEAITNESSNSSENLMNTTTTDAGYFPMNTTENDVITPNNTEYINSNNTFDYEDYESTNETKTHSISRNRTNTILNLFFNNLNRNIPHVEPFNETTIDIPDTQQLENTTIKMNDSGIHENHHSVHTFLEIDPTTPTPTRHTPKKKRKNDRCKEADFQVCKDFSKRRLLRIQACCLFGGNNYKTACRSFTPRRCKKMQTVIKCCIKTAFAEKMTTDRTTTEIDITPVVTEIETTTVAPSVVCCKNTLEGRICNASPTGNCEGLDEYPLGSDTAATNEIGTESSM